MKVTGTTQTTRTNPRKTEPKKKSELTDDGFEAPVKKAAPKRTTKTPRVEASPALVRAGTTALERDKKNTSDIELRDAGWLLGGLTASVVLSVMHQFQTRPRPVTRSRSAATRRTLRCALHRVHHLER